jgi:hypothetical protein
MYGMNVKYILLHENKIKSVYWNTLYMNDRVAENIFIYPFS